jgi:hypothetical protein
MGMERMMGQGRNNVEVGFVYRVHVFCATALQYRCAALGRTRVEEDDGDVLGCWGILLATSNLEDPSAVSRDASNDAMMQ